LKEVGEVTKVSTRYLESIEQHLFHKLPEKVFVRGFLTGYARFLKIDPEKVIHDFFQRWEEGKKR
jgi:cytoskeletal protein RodZ